MKKLLIGVVMMSLLLPSMIYSQEEELFFENVRKLVQTDKVNDAVGLLGDYNRMHPTDIRGYMMLAKIYELVGGPVNRSKAEECYLEAQKRAPRNTDVLKNLAELKKQQGFLTSADSYLNQVLELDPLDFEVNYKLLQKYLDLGDKSNIKKMEGRFSNLVMEFPNNQNAKLLLGMIYLGLNRLQEALKVLVDAANLDPTNPKVHMYIAEIYHNANNLDRFTDHYMMYLENLKDPKELNVEFLTNEIIMDNSTRTEYFKRPSEERGKYLAQYWRELDPNPITIQNERLVEHKNRIEYARQAFRTNINLLGFDDRGKVYIKYGEPDDRYMDSVSENAKGNESWTYFSIDPNLSFDFVENGGAYRETFNLLEAVMAYGVYREPYEATNGLRNILQQGLQEEDAAILQEEIDRMEEPLLDKYMVAQELYKERSHLGGVYARMATTARATFESEVFQEVVSRKWDGKTAEVPYRMVRKFEKLDFGLQTAQFRGKDNLTKVETYFGIPLDQLQVMPTEENIPSFSFLDDYFIFDSSKVRLAHQQFKQRREIEKDEDFTDKTIVSQKDAFVPPGKYQLAFQIMETTNKKADFLTTDLEVRDFTGQDLLVSGIQFSSNITEGKGNEATAKNGLLIQPYPFPYVERQKTVWAYFEIYNLMITPDGNTKYRVTLRVEQEDEPGNFISKSIRNLGQIFKGDKFQTIESTYQREGAGAMSIETIALDFSTLPVGNTRFTIEVRDMNSGMVASSNKEFQIVNEDDEKKNDKDGKELADKAGETDTKKK